MKKIFPFLLPLFLLAACEKDYTPRSGALQEITFNATLEQPTNGENNQKVILSQEHYIFWEWGDNINIGSELSTEATWGDLINAAPGSDFDGFNGVFMAPLPEGSTKFLGLFPKSENNVIVGKGNTHPYFSSVIIDLPTTQPLRNDNTFSKQVFPMVAWYGGSWDAEHPTPFNLDFHSLGAIVRVQIFNNTSDDKTVRQIVFTNTIESNKPISGLFYVDSFYTANPSLIPTGNREGSTVTITCYDDETDPLSGVVFPANQLLTFYLVLPAFGGRGETTEFTLQMDVQTTDSKHCIKNFKAKTRRNGITYLNAMGINNWETGEGAAGLVGNGTEERPFKIYTITDLQKLRDCYNTVGTDGYRRINGQVITPNTYIKLMRSDIQLTAVNWTSSIRNFVGHFTSVAHQSNPGIENASPNEPLFESISEGGIVEGLSLKSSVAITTNNATGFSPFCTQNAGTMKDCVITIDPAAPTGYNRAVFSPFAGICVTNTGTLDGCRYESKTQVEEGKNFAGICMHNSGTIQGCQFSSTYVLFTNPTSKAAGICYENKAGGTVKDCYFASSISNSEVGWAGIVYENSGTVEHCYLSNNAHIYTTKNVGGIVVTNKTGGKVDYCWLEGQLRGKTVGGIVENQTGGTVINCFNQGSAMITVTNDATGIGGGLVGSMSGGSIVNSYVLDIVIQRQNESATIGGIVGKVTGGTVNNCYALEAFHLFYGTSSDATYTRCYLVNGTQTGPTYISETLANAATGTTGCLVDLLNDATEGAPFITGAKAWTGAPPALAPYSVTP
jgi:hypothetical protein